MTVPEQLSLAFGLVLAALCWLRRSVLPTGFAVGVTGAFAACMAVQLLHFAGVGLARAPGLSGPFEPRRDWLILAIFAAGLLLFVLQDLARWWKRRQAWATDTSQLIETPVGSTGSALGAIQGFAAAMLFSLVSPWARPLLLGLAALHTLGAGHVRREGVAADMLRCLGLVLALAAGASVAGWLNASSSGLWLGIAIAGVWAAWLVKFWDQQLLEEKPWTEAGALIPVARRLAVVISGFGLALLICGIETDTSATLSSGWTVWLGLLGLLLLMLMQFADAAKKGGALPLVGAIAAGLTAAGPAITILRSNRTMVDPLIAISSMALIAAITMRIPRYERATLHRTALNAMLTGGLPFVVLFQVASQPVTTERIAALAVSALAAILVLGNQRLAA